MWIFGSKETLNLSCDTNINIVVILRQLIFQQESPLPLLFKPVSVNNDMKGPFMKCRGQHQTRYIVMIYLMCVGGGAGPFRGGTKLNIIHMSDILLLYATRTFQPPHLNECSYNPSCTLLETYTRMHHACSWLTYSLSLILDIRES